jgi:two-component system LytT family sensor kinase
MRTRPSLYWRYQLGGWLLYGLFMMLLTSILDKRTNAVFYPRVFLTIIFGIIFTHILRKLIIKLELHPPVQSRKWGRLSVVVVAIVLLYCLTNSAVVEWLRIYDSRTRIPVEKRFMSNLISDAPLILIWVSIYYIWHYVKPVATPEIQKVKLDSLVKELELKTLKSHINPHFIFNALTSIRLLVEENPEKARTAITALSNILRSSIQADKLEQLFAAEFLRGGSEVDPL